jgi:adenylate cyclase
MGRVQLRGRAKPVDIYEPAPEFPAEDRAKLKEASALADDNPEAARALVDDVVTRHPDDLALRNLKQRMENLTEGGAYVLG